MNKKYFEGTKPSQFKFPPCPQMDLYNYLKPEQQEVIRPILRGMKKSHQVELCIMLLDYMEFGEIFFSNNPLIDGMFIYLTRYNMPDADNPQDKRVIRPLKLSDKATATNGSPLNLVLKKIFPFLHSKD